MESAPSPCKKICELNDEGVCKGCLRTIEEITAWPALDDAEKRKILQRLESDAKQATDDD